MIQDFVFGPVNSTFGAATSGGWIRPRGPLPHWGYSITVGGSTSTVTVKHKLQGTLDPSTAPAAASIFTISTGSGAGHVGSTGYQPATQVRVTVTTLTSTSSTAPSAASWVAGTI